MIYVEMVEEVKPEGHTRGKDYNVCNGNPNQFRATPRKEYEAQEKSMDYENGLTERMPL